MQENSIVIPKARRIVSIDLLRGVVMIIMALDHVRDFFHWSAHNYDPLDLEHTSTPIFLTRWITHFCAPVFVFLAGTSAYFIGTRKSKAEVSKFLFTRGVWLILLEVTILNFGWFFNATFSTVVLMTIWSLGIGMVSLSVLIFLPKRLLLAVGLLIVFGHNLLDNIHVEGNNLQAFVWAVLHDGGDFKSGYFRIFVAYPVLSWMGLMAVGYCFGELYTALTPEKRKQVLIKLGVGCILLFVALRFTNWYGDYQHWSVQKNAVYTILSFINTVKYPPSLLYMLMTIGPSLLFLAFSEKPLSKAGKMVSVFGRVPLFYYILHIYVIHLSSNIAIVLSGYGWKDVFANPFFNPVKTFGYPLVVVYIIWILVVVLLYPLSKWYDSYKLKHKEKWWLSYL